MPATSARQPEMKRAIDLKPGDVTSNYVVVDEPGQTIRDGVPCIVVAVQYIDGGFERRAWERSIGADDPTVGVIYEWDSTVQGDYYRQAELYGWA